MTLPSDNSTLLSVMVDREELLHFSDDEEWALSEDESSPPSPERELNLSPDVARRSFKRKDTEHGNLRNSSSVKKPESQPEIKSVNSSCSMASLPAMQKAFQPCSTQPDSGIRHLLTYNLIGSVTSCQNEGLSHVEVEFHDTGRGVHVPSMTDYFGFTMAAMNEMGSAFASPKKGEKSPSTVLYRPFSSWASNSEWSMRFPAEEEVRALAVGSSWVAAATSLNHLRVFSEGGLQTSVVSLQGPVVTMAGNQDTLAVATHAALPLTCGQQGLLRIHSNQYGGCWIPVFSASKEVKNEDESIWMVGLNDTQAMCVVCKLPDKQPQVSPKPILSIFNLSLPLVHSDLGAEDLENEFLLKSWHLAQMTDEVAHLNDGDDQEEEILKLEANLDRCILRLLAAACKGDKLVKAVELTKKLTLDKSWKGAIKLVNAMKLPALAECLSIMYGERMAQEESQNQRQLVESTHRASDVRTAAPDTRLNSADTKSGMAILQEAAPVGRHVENDASNGHASTHKQSAPSTVAKLDVWKEKKAVNKAAKSFNAVVPPHAEQNGIHAGDNKTPSNAAVQDEPVHRPSNPFAKSSSNPFAKSPGNTDSQSGVSLLDSFKETEGLYRA